jgi:hypothetical protein
MEIRMRIASNKKRNDECLDSNLTFFFKEKDARFRSYQGVRLTIIAIGESLFCSVLDKSSPGEVTHNKRAP